MPEGGSAVLPIPTARAGEGAGAPGSGEAAALGRPAGEAAGDLAFQGGTSVPAGKGLQVRGCLLVGKTAAVFL